MHRMQQEKRCRGDYMQWDYDLNDSFVQRMFELSMALFRELFRLRRHHLTNAALKLAFLIPLLVGVTAVGLRKRESPFAPILYSAFAASFWMVAVVMHQHFPSEYFKYIAIAAGGALFVLGLPDEAN